MLVDSTRLLLGLLRRGYVMHEPAKGSPYSYLTIPGPGRTYSDFEIEAEAYFALETAIEAAPPGMQNSPDAPMVAYLEEPGHKPYWCIVLRSSHDAVQYLATPDRISQLLLERIASALSRG